MLRMEPCKPWLSAAVLSSRLRRTYRPCGGVLDVCVGILLQRREQEAQPALHQLAQRLHALQEGSDEGRE